MSNRKSFVFSEEAAERLERLRVAFRLPTGSNVIRLALMVLEDLLGALNRGQSIVFVSPDGSERSYHPLLTPGDAAVMRSETAQEK